MQKKRAKYYSLLERRYYQKSLKAKVNNQSKILQEKEN